MRLTQRITYLAPDSPAVVPPPEDVTRLQDKLLQFIEKSGYAGFGALTKHAESCGFEVCGEGTIFYCHPRRNIVLWDSTTILFSTAISGLLQGKEIFFEQSSWIDCLLLDHAVLDLPTTDRIPPGGCKRLKWFPVVFRSVPF